jgi:hypothetical protein
VWRKDITDAANDRPQGTEYRIRVLACRPQRLETLLREEHACQVCLRVEVDNEHSLAAICNHGGDVVDERCFADAALVVEERDRLHVRLLIVARTYPASN